MKGFIRTILFASLALVLLAGCNTKTPSSSGPSPSPSQSTGRPAVDSVAYVTTGLDAGKPSDQSDLWLYDPATDKTTRLTNDGRTTVERQPRLSAGKITYIAVPGTLIEIDLSTGVHRTLFTADTAILAYAISPDRQRVAYIEVNYERDSIHHFRVRDLATGRIVDLKTLGVPLGRGGGDDDVVSVVWNRAGDKLLINDTHLDDYATVRVVSAVTGNDVITAVRVATGAFWSKDERSIFVIITPAKTGIRSWYRIDMSTEARQKLGIDPKVVHARLSPDGTKIAATTFISKDSYSIYLYDLVTEKGSFLAGGSRDPMWLDDDTMIATHVQRCSMDEDSCNEQGFQGRWTITLAANGTTERISMGTTLWGLNPNVDVAS